MSSIRSLAPRRLVAALLPALAAPVLLAAQASTAGNVADSPAYATSAPARDALARRIDAVLSRPSISRVTWGIEVRDAATGTVVYARNAARPMVPASNLKLVVTATAAHHLDPDYRFRTSVYATGPVVDGVLQGDLVLYGRGDPMISGRYFGDRTAVLDSMADSLAARGIRRVTGGVIADESWWDREYVRPDWDPADRLWWYAAPVSALLFNDNSIDVTLRPGASAGTPARVTAEPSSGAYRLRNEARTVASGGSRTIDLQRGTAPGEVRAVGQVPVDAGADEEHFAVDDAARWTGTVFRETLERRGIDVARDEIRIVSDPSASVSGGSAAVFDWRSPPLPQAIGPVLLNSQNLFAEVLVKTLGREVRGQGSWDAGLALERAFLTGVVGVDSADFVLRDGSGLSDGNRVTPRALARLLDYVRRTPRLAVVRQKLPVSAAREGSLRSRFQDLPGRVAAKTGYIGGVNSLSGYLTMRDGRELIFVIIGNGEAAQADRIRAIDDVVRAIAAEDGR
ncbi:D-alanyl-D-alanine carboxypeptidase/D-alanyl-D-alanine endopeptidase [Longimicrobium sp.]|uniref:D-alanyl-D-alanine carboxypeptidase/D-alanyl-D-alanine endopeptidase n=1 Tax=Longimicrobium sp. TaxID=2029185 RepID=UPI002E31F8B6|nr:D-alanyl-D-alanine carboxypeptidase/D-alanyl-D-alanine-endopeptidase [Longimicrobium sp.]HEX6039113.1 D-alanyl-D-alanine carboxypeptidase/D-alanyl-D-alanine-endopeptidase [Longimicrobium sp.]